MIGGNVRLALSVLFAVLGAWYLAAGASALRSPGSRRGREAFAAALHVVMSAAMISMFWSWGADIPVMAQVTVFTAAAAWFVAQAAFGTDGHPGAWCSGNWYHAGMMTVMAWMPVAMELMSPPQGSGTSGMSMPSGMQGMVMDRTVAGLSSAGPPGWTGTVCLVLAGPFFAAAAWQAVTALRPLASPDSGRSPWQQSVSIVLREGAGALAAAGMAAALLQLA